MNNMQNHIDELILAYLNQDLDEAGRDELTAWVADGEEHKAYFRQTCEVWLLSGSERIRDHYNARRAFDLFREEHLDELDPDGVNHTSRRSPQRTWLWMGIAAAVAVFAVGGAFLLGTRQGASALEGQFHDITIEAPFGSSSRVTLPDGTAVTMNAGSRITYSQGFGISDRDLQLSGEAYFEVARNEDLPMRVASSDLLVRVVGTRFNFRDYPEDLEAIISLQDGKVSLTNKLQPAESEKYLNPNQRVVLDKHSGDMHIESKDAANAMQWTTGNLFFDEVLLSDIVKDLERYYDVHISLLGDELRSMRVYVSFARREMTIEDILDILAATNKLSYRMEGRAITLRGTNSK